MPAKSTFSLRASRYNLSDSVEKIPETNHTIKGTDAADGQQNGEFVPNKFNESVKVKVNPLPQKAESIASGKKVPISSVASDADSNPDKRSKVGSTMIEESRSVEKVIRSPRALLLAQTNGETAPSAPVQAAANGLVTSSIPNNTEIYITHVRSHRQIYIRSALTNEEYAKLINEVEEVSKTQPKLTVYPTRNDVVMAPFDGMYYRAMVISCNKPEGMVKVGFIDFGNSVS